MESATITHKFRDLLATDQLSASLLQLDVSVQVESVQSQGAINFTLGIHNRNPEPIEIPNPIDYINFILQDERGLPVSTPPVISRLKLPESEWETWQNEFFKPLAIFLGADELPTAVEIKKKTIFLPQAETYTITFQLSGLKQPGQTQEQETVPIPAGVYQLTLTYTLLLANTSGQQNRLLQADGLLIHLLAEE